MLDAHREEALAAVRRRVGDVDDAEDCVQDAILRLVQRDDLDPDRVGALLSRVAVHIAIDRTRARRRADQLAERIGFDAKRQVAWPEQVVADRTEADRVWRAVETLPPREREVMRLRLLAGFSVSETARLLGVTYKSIEGTYTRGRARLRLTLGGGLAWLAARLRRFVAPQSGESLAAAVAVVAVLVVGPFWRHVIDASRGSGAGAAAAVLAASGPASPPAHGGAAASGLRLRISSEGSRGAGGGGPAAGHRDRGQQPQTIFTTGPVPTVPDPRPGQQQPLISGQGVTISGGGSLDPVGGIEQCLAQGGPTAQETIGNGISGGGGCDT